MRNVMLLALTITTLSFWGCSPEPVDASRTDVEGPPATISHPPTDIVVVLDTSHSMTRPQMEMASSVLDYLVSVLDENDRFALVAIRKEASVVIEPSPATPDVKSEWMRTIRSLEAEGLTNLEDGLELAKTLASPETRMLLVSDGSATWGSVVREELVEKAAGLNLWTVGVGRHDQTLLRALGHYVEASQPSEVADALLTPDTPDATTSRSPEPEHRGPRCSNLRTSSFGYVRSARSGHTLAISSRISA